MYLIQSMVARAPARAHCCALFTSFPRCALNSCFRMRLSAHTTLGPTPLLKQGSARLRLARQCCLLCRGVSSGPTRPEGERADSSGPDRPARPPSGRRRHLRLADTAGTQRTCVRVYVCMCGPYPKVTTTTQGGQKKHSQWLQFLGPGPGRSRTPAPPRRRSIPRGLAAEVARSGRSSWALVLEGLAHTPAQPSRRCSQ